MLRSEPASRTETTLDLNECREREGFVPFAFRLRGILPSADKHRVGGAECVGNQIVNCLAAALPLGVRLQFHHQRLEPGEMGWSLGGVEDATNPGIIATLASVLAATRGGFQFEAGAPLPVNRSLHCVRLRPVGCPMIVSRGASPGFGRPCITPSVPVRIPEISNLRAPVFPSLGSLLQSAPCEVTASVGVTRIRLSPAELAAVQEAMRRLSASPAKADHLAAGFLEKWVTVPCGWRLECEVASREPLPEPFLQLIGGEVFGEAVEVFDVNGSVTDGGQLDLATCCHALGALPRLFPAETLRASLQQPRSYNSSLPELPASGVLIGEVECNGALHDLRLPAEARDRHLFALGGTGCGKSTLLLNLIRQDIEAGEGVALIDPHGDLFEQVLASIPSRRIGDVVLFEPGRGSRAPGLNFLEVADGPFREVQRNFIINELMGIFEQLWDMRQCGGPMFQNYFRNVVLLLMGGSGRDATLTELPLVFEDRAFRERLKAACKDPMVTGFWTNQAEKAGGDAALNNIAPYITCKLNVFTHSSVLRPIIGQARTTLDFRGMLAKGGIFLANLSKGLIGSAEARLLGMLILGRIFVASMERCVLPQAKRRPFSLFVDETQNFVTPTLASMLSEARKFGLRLTLANQNLAQLEGQEPNSLLNALLGNVGSLLTFRVGPEDAEKMAMYTQPAFDAETLTRLPNFHAAGRILTSQGPLEPVVFRTLPSAPPEELGTVAAIRRKQRSYTRNIADVEKEIRARRQMNASEGAKVVPGKVTFLGN